MEPNAPSPLPFVLPAKTTTKRAVDIKPGAMRYGECEHATVYLNPENRTVECRACGAPVDPFDHLLTIMRYGLGLDCELYALEQARAAIARHEEDRQAVCKHKHASVRNGAFWCPSCGLRRIAQ